MATWIPVIVALLSAVLSAYLANKSRVAEFQAQRILERERRIAARVVLSEFL